MSEESPEYSASTGEEKEQSKFLKENIKSRAIWFRLFFMLVAVLPAVSFAQIQVTETLLSFDAADDFAARISGDNVVFTTLRAGTQDIYGVQPGAVAIGIAVGPSTQNQADISGTSVVFVDDTFGDKNIYVRDFFVAGTRLLTLDAGVDDRPAIDGDDVVFITLRAGNDDVYRIDLTTDFVFPVATTPFAESLAAIDAGLISYQRFEFPVNNVYATNIGGAEFPVAVTAGPSTNPSISGTLIAYIESGDVQLFDTTTGQTTPITNDTAIQRNVVIDGTNIVWSDDRNGNDDIFLYDLIGGQEYQLTTDPSDQHVTDLDGDRAVFQDDRFGDLNIWLLAFTIDPSVHAALDFIGGVASGPGADIVAGWEFTADQPVEVLSLGLWDEGGDGLTNSHTVGLYTIGQQLLTSRSISSGSGSPSTSPDGAWVFTAIAPIVLDPGTYVIAATYRSGDADLGRFTTTATTIPAITFVSSRVAVSSSLVFPTLVTAPNDDGIFGPNLLVRAVVTQHVPSLSVEGFAVIAILMIFTAALKL